MGFNDFAKGKETAPRPAARAGVGALTAFIDQGSEFTGKLSFKDTVRIDGRFEGEIASDNTLIVGETGQVHAEIKSDTVVISGEVKGDIVARSQITLHKTARVTGNVATGVLVVEEGSELNGRVTMTRVAPAEKAARLPEANS
jgi:cytoskeletal protein CcmA (bactofilin family)